MPEGIGRGAERVLQGCLERSIQDRWTIEMVDEVAWGIGWGDAGDEAPCPEEMLPPTRSRSRSRPAFFPEHAVIDDHDAPRSPVMERPSTSRSRSGRSRSRLSAFHPYQHDQHFPSPLHDVPEPSLSGLHSSILRSISTTSSSSSDYFSSVGSPQSAILSHSAERGRMHLGHGMPSASRSRSPLESPVTPIDVAAALATRGRKVSRATVSSGPIESRRLAHLPENDISIPEEITPFSHWVTSPDNEDRKVTRSASRDNYSRTRPNLLSNEPPKDARAESVPPHSLCSLPWSARSFQLQGARILTSTPSSVHGKTAASRSRSVGFDLIGPQRLKRPCDGL